MRITCVTVDCLDPLRVAEFWNEALRWDGVADVDDGEVAVCRSPEGGIFLEFVRVPEAKKIKNRQHLGCHAGSLDGMEAEIERLVDLGASIAWEEEFPAEISAQYRNVILRDVEGNEFCLGAGAMPTQ